MTNKSSRRKFIAAAVSGAAASVTAGCSPSAVFAGEQPKENAPWQGKYISAQQPVLTQPKRVAPSEFIIFPWGRMPGSIAGDFGAELDDKEVMDVIMRDIRFDWYSFSDKKIPSIFHLMTLMTS